MAEVKESPLVKAVLALDNYLSEIERLGVMLNTMDLKSDFDFEQAQRLLKRFAECGQGVSTEVVNLSSHLNEARLRAEAIAQGVSACAEQLSARKTEEQKKMEEFRLLGEKVRELSLALNQLKPSEGSILSDHDKAKLSMALSGFEGELELLILQAQALKNEAHKSKMKSLEQNTDSLAQTLQAVRQKLSAMNLSGQHGFESHH